MQTLRVLIVSDAQPRLAWRLAERIKNEVPNVSVCGFVYQAPKKLPESLKVRLRNWAVSSRDVLLRLAHAFPLTGSLQYCFTPDDLVRRGVAAGWPVKLCDKLDSSAISDFVNNLNPDLCLVWTDPVPTSDPARTSVFATLTVNRMPSDTTGPGMEIHVSHVGKGQAMTSALCSAHLPLEPYDTQVSQKLKAELISMDLLVQGVAVMGGGPAHRTLVQERNPLTYLQYWQKRGARNGPANPPVLRTRPWWKLCVASILLAPYVVVRNWHRRLRGRFPITILFHHLISDVPHHLGMPTDAFFREVNFLTKHYRIISLSEAADLLKSGKVKEPTAVLTFDDGYQENFITLRAVTEATGIPTACFVCTQIAERRAEFEHDLRKKTHNFASLNWEQIAYLSRNGVEIGSHTRTHLDCGTNDETILREEIVGAKADLEQHGEPVRFFAFPFGKRENMSKEALELAAEQYEYSLSCLGGDNFPNSRSRHRHLIRKGLPKDVWELELTLQAILDLKQVLKRRVDRGKRAQL